ncbi:RWD domain-containing protein 2B [Tyrophagus putrescentiae]|nr:RWD domain-containing protein 2B [Tyrophagus putrescentiae]
MLVINSPGDKEDDDGGDPHFDRRLTDLALLAAMYPGQVLLDDDHLQNEVIVGGNVEAKIGDGKEEGEGDEDDDDGEDQTISGRFTLEDGSLEVAFVLAASYPQRTSSLETPSLRLHVRILKVLAMQDSSGLRALQRQFNEEVMAIVVAEDEDQKEFSLIDACQAVIRLWEEKLLSRGGSASNEEEVEERKATTNDDKDESLCRYWIYSHHIKSTSKRRLMRQLADDLQLNGLMLIGKPGFIVIEGRHSDCEAWWAAVRALTWQRITLVETEEMKEDDHSKRIFDSFTEQTDRSAVFRRLQASGADGVLRSFLGLGSTS